MSHALGKINRRRFLQTSAAGLWAGLQGLVPAYAGAYPSTGLLKSVGAQGEAIDLRVGKSALQIDNKRASAVTVNETIPGPLIRLREGQLATLRVRNDLDVDSSIHWHGLILPPAMDGVPGVSFAGIKPGETFTYQFPVRQHGTYWYHSHSGTQEQQGHYGPIIIDPIEAEPFAYDREYVVVLSDWSFEDPHAIMSRLKSQSDYYNFQQQTVGDFFADVKKKGWDATVSDRLAWARMRMSPTDIADVTGYTYTYLMNGMASVSNWTGLFRRGERIRLRFINASAMSYFDVRIPGLAMTVVQADGQNVQPVTVDEFRIAVAETYDVIVQPQEPIAYTVYAEAMDRSGYARGTLAPNVDMSAPVPPRRARSLLTMADMGMDMSAHDMSGMDMSGGASGSTMSHDMPGMDMSGGAGGSTKSHDMPGMDMSGGAGGSTMSHDMPGMDRAADTSTAVHGPDHHGPSNTMVAERAGSRLHERGRGLENSPGRVLVYTDLRSVALRADQRPPERELELHLTGNMERYMWSFDGKKFSQVDGPIPFSYGERLRLTLVNDTMMEHPIHLHGMWMELENGAGRFNPRKHTISVKPAEKLSLLISADALGDWAFHCHLLYHMEMGMFRVVSVTDKALG